ncbi:hypothetical protein [Aureliella helgolandensis]|uniref:Uncharacterized protein n=1 Tax=Aureliella helgolandensis TaxID=2527968 RepID=A0A518G6Y7_9BACT|nr:hypothetical protein [Aureliella helgolandensis]QDV24345.1 hypothetical protein Q31a_26610 [Aureliella helgolandensis]
MSQEPQPLRLSRNIVDKLDDVRSLLRRYVLLQTLFVILCWLLLVFWLGGMLDYLPVRAGSSETPRWVRMGFLGLMLGGGLAFVLRWTLPRLFARLPNRSLALLIERHYPELDNELVTAVELSDGNVPDTSNPAAHAQMLERVHSSISRRIGNVAPSELFSWQPLWATGVAAVFGLVVTCIAALGMNGWMTTWTTRLFGLSDQLWPRNAELRADGVQLQVPTFTGQLSAERVMIPFADQTVRIPIGSAALLQVSADVSASQVPEVCTLFYRTEEGNRGRANLRRVGAAREGWQQFTIDGPPLDGITESLTLDVVGLDARLRDLTLQVVEPIAITAMTIDCQYPTYLVDAQSSRPQREALEYRSGLSIPEGTQVTLRGTASGALSRVEYVKLSGGGSPGPSGSSSETSLQIQPATVDGQTFAIPLGAMRASQIVEIRLLDEYGLPAEQIPRYVVTVLEDQIPEVASRLQGIGVAVTPNASLPIRGTATDDNGLARLYVELVLDDSARVDVDVDVPDNGELNTDIDLALLDEQGILTAAPGQTLGIVVKATDHFDLQSEVTTPGKETPSQARPARQRPLFGQGQAQQLSIVTPDQLLVLLDRQELEQRQRLELITTELEQMRDLLQNIRANLQALDSPNALKSNARNTQLVSLPQVGDAQPTLNARQEVQRRVAVWTQQCVLQSDKSDQELASLASRVDNLRMQLVNNRIDSLDRQARLQSNVFEPLRSLLENEYEQLQAQLLGLTAAVNSGDGKSETQATIAQLDAVLLRLEEIKSSMLDMESFNEIVDLVRGLLEDQEQLLDATEQEQRKRILDFLQ